MENGGDFPGGLWEVLGKVGKRLEILGRDVQK